MMARAPNCQLTILNYFGSGFDGEVGGGVSDLDSDFASGFEESAEGLLLFSTEDASDLGEGDEVEEPVFL